MLFEINPPLIHIWLKIITVKSSLLLSTHFFEVAPYNQKRPWQAVLGGVDGNFPRFYTNFKAIVELGIALLEMYPCMTHSNGEKQLLILWMQSFCKNNGLINKQILQLLFKCKMSQFCKQKHIQFSNRSCLETPLRCPSAPVLNYLLQIAKYFSIGQILWLYGLLVVCWGRRHRRCPRQHAG